MSLTQETSTTPEPTDPVGSDPSGTTPDTGASSAPGGLFGAFWRWHFYASVLVIPILFILATTGRV